MASVPHLPMLLVWYLFGLLHMTGTPIAITFLVAGWTGSYALAGTVFGLLTAGVSIAGPLLGRAADRQSATRLLAMTSAGYGLGLTALAFLPRSAWPAALVIAPLAGLCMPPVAPLGRATWERTATGDAREATYTVESTLRELLWVIGPMLSAGAVAVFGARIALLGCATTAFLAPAGFGLMLRRAGLNRPAAAMHPAARHDRAPCAEPARRVPLSLFTVPGLARLIAAAVLMTAALNDIDLVMVAWSRDRGTPALAGTLAAVLAIGSMSGGLISGLASGPAHLPRRFAGLALSVGLIVPTLPPILHNASPLLVGAVLLIGGTAIAPTMAAHTARVGEMAPSDRRGEVFGWLSSAYIAGGALSAPVTGWLVDRYGPAVAVAGGAAAAAVATLLSMGQAVGPRHPPTRYRNAASPTRCNDAQR
jgi:predicted MFS family arabinose efflux permease